MNHKKLNSVFASCTMLFILLACAQTYSKKSIQLRQLLNERKFKQAFEFVYSPQFHQEKTLELLRLLERGTVEHYAGQYYISAKTFEQAKNLSDALYTVSLSKKALSYLINDNSDLYYSLKFEQSQIRFYLTLNYMLLSQQAKYACAYENGELKYQKNDLKSAQNFLTMARATVLEWDTLLNQFKEFYAGKPIFKNDLMKYLLGSEIHRRQSIVYDKQISLDLLKESADLLYKNYGLYESFNQKYIPYLAEFDNLQNFSQEKFQAEYFSPTTNTLNLLQLVKQSRNNISQSTQYVTLILESGTIAEKYEHVVTTPAGQKVNIPDIENIPNQFDMKIEVTSPNQQKLVFDAPIVSPLSQIAYTSHLHLREKVLTKSETQKLLKQGLGAALLVAGASNSDSSAGLVMMSLGVAFQVFAQESDKADIRYWSSLPSDIRIAKLEIAKGKYQFNVLIFQEDQLLDKIYLGEKWVNDNGLLNFKI